MATGIAGDNDTVLDGISDETLAVVELRVISNLLQSLLGTNQAQDRLATLRNDQAFELSIQPPVIPGYDR